MMKIKQKGIVIAVVVICIVVTAIIFNINKPTGSNKIENKKVVMETKNYSATMNIEDFIVFVLMKEMPRETSKEMLKAQGVVIRTYILKIMANENIISSKKLGLPFATPESLRKLWYETYRMKNAGTITGVLCNFTEMGEGMIYRKYFNKVKATLKKTKTTVMKSNNELVLPMFHEISSGKTDSGNDILGEKYNYLKSVECSQDLNEKGYINTKYFSVNDFINNLNKYGIIIYKNKKEFVNKTSKQVTKLIKEIDCSHRNETNHIISLKIGDTWITGEEFKKAMGLSSTNFNIKEENKKIKIVTYGSGHNLGMSLAYGKWLGEKGYSWERILKYFYNVTLCQY